MPASRPRAAAAPERSGTMRRGVLGLGHDSRYRHVNEATPPGRPGSLFPTAPAGPAAIDPVCGMTVSPATAPASTVYGGTTYSFCCPGCRKKFEADPARYLHGSPEGHPP